MATKYRPDISLNVERRAQEHEPSALLTEERAPAKQKTPVRTHNAALTHRERRVKNMLLKELSRMNDVRRLTYNEIQHLEKGLNVAFIDKELAKMRKQYRMLPYVLGLAVGLSVICGLALWDEIARGTFSISHLSMFCPVLSGIIIPLLGMRSLQRKIFIYEALRELSGANEMDVVLDRVVLDADALIDRILGMELQAEEEYPINVLRRVTTN